MYFRRRARQTTTRFFILLSYCSNRVSTTIFWQRKCIRQYITCARAFFHSSRPLSATREKSEVFVFTMRKGHSLGRLGPPDWLICERPCIHYNGRSTRRQLSCSLTEYYYNVYRGGVFANAAPVGAVVAEVAVDDSPAVMNGCSSASDDLIRSFGS
jgi:hypothetical protein